MAPGPDCWHYGINWHLVSAAAIDIALQAPAHGTSPEDALDVVDSAACGLDWDDRDGLISLLSAGEASRSTKTAQTM